MVCCRRRLGLIDKYTAVAAMSAGMIVGYVKYYYGRIWNIYEGLWGLLANLLVLSIMLLIKKLIKGKQ